MATKKAVLYYRSGWKSAYIHMSDHSGWETSQLTRSEQYSGWYQIQVVVPQNGRAFVMTNGEGGWDNPAPACKRQSASNYFLT
jgi:hypothetical protein